MNPRKVFLYSLIGSVALCAVIGIVVILFGEFGEFETKVLLTTITVAVTSILGLACGAYLEAGRGKAVPVAGIIFAISSGVLWLIMIWYRGDPSLEWFPKTTMTATLLAASFSHLSLLSLARLEKKFIWSRYALYSLVGILTAVLILLIWYGREMDEEVVGRVVGVLSILVASLTIVTPIFHKLSHGEQGAEGIDDEIRRLKARIEELEAKKIDLLAEQEIHGARSG